MPEVPGVKSAHRVFQILEFFAETKRPASMPEIRKHLGLPRSSCFALIETLKGLGYLYYIEREGGYYPTHRWHEMTQIIAAHDPVLGKLEPLLIQIRDACSETVILGELVDDQVLYLQVVEGDHDVRVAATSGERKPVYASAAGHALLGAMAPDERETLLGKLKLTKFTDKTCVNKNKLERRIVEGEARGWFSAIGEHKEDTGSIAVGLEFGLTQYAISVGAPVYRLEQNVDRIKDILIDLTGAFQRRS